MDLSELEEKIGITLDQWQRDFVLCKDFGLILKMGRKCGKTLAMSVKIVFDAINNSDWKVVVLSRGQRQSSEVFDEVHHLLQILECDIQYASRTKVVLGNNHTIYSLPTGYAGVTLRTYSFHKIYYDEAAYIPDDVYDATTPCLAVHGIQKILASTPFGLGGFFYREWHNKDFTRWEQKTALCPRVSREYLRKERARMTKVQFQQEYEGIFTEQADGLVASDLLRQAMKPLEFEDYIRNGTMFLGVDFARFGKDDNVIAYCHYKNNKASIIKLEVFKGRHRMTTIVGRIVAIKKKYPNIRKIITDETGVGGGATDMLIEKLGKRAVIGVQNHSRPVEYRVGRRAKILKEDLYANLIKMLENGQIDLIDDVQIIRSLRSVKFDYRTDGSLRIFGRDTHIAEAIVRAIFPLMTGIKPQGTWVSGV